MPQIKYIKNICICINCVTVIIYRGYNQCSREHLRKRKNMTGIMLAFVIIVWNEGRANITKGWIFIASLELSFSGICMHKRNKNKKKKKKEIRCIRMWISSTYGSIKKKCVTSEYVDELPTFKHVLQRISTLRFTNVLRS